MNPEHTLLWDKVRLFEIDDISSAFTFSDRLARDNGWSLEFAIRAVSEYKKFMFLLCMADHPLTPSDEVDQVWHLHLLYTESYWEDFCTHTLGRPVHHGPTRGGGAENEKFADWYERTLQLYKSVFETDAPGDIWPPSNQRFSGDHFERVNRTSHWVIRKPFTRP